MQHLESHFQEDQRRIRFVPQAISESPIALGPKEGYIDCLGFGSLFPSSIFCLLKKHLSSSLNMNFLYHVPTLAPPAGVTSNFKNPESQSLLIIVTSILCFVLISFISIVRFYTNLWIKKSLKADDSKYINKHLSMRIANRISCMCIRRCRSLTVFHCLANVLF